jgi:chemotaxis protein methyltransferase CheR
MIIPTALDDEQYRRFSELIYERSGICLGDHKRDLVHARLMKRLRSSNCRSFDEYYNRVVNDQSGAELISLIDAISTNVTEFFREDRHFDYLSSQIIPRLISQRSGSDRVIRIWSAACSSGEEVYSLLITVLETLGPAAGDWDIRILGTDISTRVLALARQARYSEIKLSSMPGDYKNRYFEKIKDRDGVCFVVRQQYRSMVTFARMNLMERPFPLKNPADVIFCRNVMIYFNREDQCQLVAELYRHLNPDGYLFIGHSEGLLGIHQGFNRVAPAVFRKV